MKERGSSHTNIIRTMSKKSWIRSFTFPLALFKDNCIDTWCRHILIYITIVLCLYIKLQSFRRSWFYVIDPCVSDNHIFSVTSRSWDKMQMNTLLWEWECRAIKEVLETVYRLQAFLREVRYVLIIYWIKISMWNGAVRVLWGGGSRETSLGSLTDLMNTKKKKKKLWHSLRITRISSLIVSLLSPR